MVPWGFLILAFLVGTVAGYWLVTALLDKVAAAVNYAIVKVSKTADPFS